MAVSRNFVPFFNISFRTLSGPGAFFCLSYFPASIQFLGLSKSVQMFSVFFHISQFFLWMRMWHSCLRFWSYACLCFFFFFIREQSFWNHFLTDAQSSCYTMFWDFEFVRKRLHISFMISLNCVVAKFIPAQSQW